jgi:hypothetical protein
MRAKVVAVSVALAAGLVGIPVISYARENHLLAAERSRVHGLVRVGQRISDAETAIRRSGYRIYGDAPTRYLEYEQLLVIIGDTSPSTLDTLCYVIGRPNPLSTQSPYVTISATLDGVITRVE